MGSLSPPLAGLNLATLLPDPNLDAPLSADISRGHGWHRDLSDQLLGDTDATWFMDWSNHLTDGQGRAEAVVVDDGLNHCPKGPLLKGQN